MSETYCRLCPAQLTMEKHYPGCPVTGGLMPHPPMLDGTPLALGDRVVVAGHLGHLGIEPLEEVVTVQQIRWVMPYQVAWVEMLERRQQIFTTEDWETSHDPPNDKSSANIIRRARDDE